MSCRILKEERNYILQMIKKIRASGCNVLLIQKSILRDAVTDLSLHYLVPSPFLPLPSLVHSTFFAAVLGIASKHCRSLGSSTFQYNGR